MIYNILNLKISKNNNILLLKIFFDITINNNIIIFIALKIKLKHISKNQNN